MSFSVLRFPGQTPLSRASGSGRRAAAQRAILLSSPRAGSTLLSRILDSHSQIASPCEICLPYAVARTWKLFKSMNNIQKIGRYYGVKPPRSAFSLLLRRPARRHLDALTAAILNREGKSTLVIKDPRHAAHVRRVERLCGADAPKYILLHRDARAVCHSFTATLGRRPARGFRAWLECTRGMLDCQEQFPERCLPVRFEVFMADPAAESARISDFLGHAFEPTMLDYGHHDHADDHLGLWTNPKLIRSVRRGAIIVRQERPSWLDDAEVLAVYGQSQEVQQVNRRLGYESSDSECVSATKWAA
ncbi:MAG: sulfotransferase [Pirellulales bacterium]|jgi:hypothetical protein|nr:sulfotransferase [Thermoguttaceae bacterium]MDD4788523.1 sulfotransferase [Pirellulales bacterium]MDI9445569.1 sulfotransferase [Planctomycetota bacterium]NLZ02846.1 sulfotransferase [Pirellulaceae bacterium]